MHFRLLPLLAIVATFTAGPVGAHGDPHAKKSATPGAQSAEEKLFGKAGDAKKTTRTITVDMSDQMRFTPSAMSVRQGETVKFIVKNSGKTMHEFVLGSKQELKEHAELMKKFPDMEHDEPYMAHVAPGKSETIVWQFTKGGEFHFGCLLPGHFEAGMVGKINVTRR